MENTAEPGLEPELEDVLRSLGASRLDVLKKVGLPRTMPYLFAALKVAITLAFVGAVISETIASNDGIGYLMLQAASQFRVPLMFAGLFVIAGGVSRLRRQADRLHRHAVHRSGRGRRPARPARAAGDDRDADRDAVLRDA